MGLFKDGWDEFNTEERDFNDGAEVCDAELYVTHIKSRKNKVTYIKSRKNGLTYHGNTKNQHGHAEIDALYQFLRNIKFEPEPFRNYEKIITCRSKPCCMYCAAVLGSLGIIPGEGTFKVYKAMGISYALPTAVRTFLRKFHNTTEQVILNEFAG
jgi:hypothetical protein